MDVQKLIHDIEKQEYPVSQWGLWAEVQVIKSIGPANQMNKKNRRKRAS